MTEPRIAPLSLDAAKAAAAGGGVPEYATVLNLNRVLLHQPTVARNFVQYFFDLMYGTALDPRLRELAILRIAWRTGSVYEWTQHWHIAVGLGLPEADLVAVRDWRDHAGFSDADRAVLAAVDDVVDGGAIGDDAWDALSAALPDEAVRLEAVVAINGWRMVAALLESLRVPLEDGTVPWPPDGLEPEGAV